MPGRPDRRLPLHRRRERQDLAQVLAFGMSGLPSQARVHAGSVPTHRPLGARGRSREGPGTNRRCARSLSPAPANRRARLRHAEGLMGATHFLTRTLPRVRTEMSLQVMAYNLRRAIKILGAATLMAAMRTQAADHSSIDSAVRHRQTVLVDGGGPWRFAALGVFTQPRSKAVVDGSPRRDADRFPLLPRRLAESTSPLGVSFPESRPPIQHIEPPDPFPTGRRYSMSLHLHRDTAHSTETPCVCNRRRPQCAERQAHFCPNKVCRIRAKSVLSWYPRKFSAPGPIAPTTTGSVVWPEVPQ